MSSFHISYIGRGKFQKLNRECKQKSGAPYIVGMKLKLIDHESVTEETQFGTCDFCACTTETTFTTLIFKRDDGEVLRAETWDWCLGDMLTIYIDNLFDFAAWIKDQDFPDDLDITDYGTLQNVVDHYQDETGRS